MKTQRIMTRRLSLLASSALLLLAMTIMPQTVFGQKSASDPAFKVKLDFNRWHDIPELYADMERLEKAFPEFLTMESIGKSYNGLDIMVMKINNPKTGNEMSKSAMYIDANIHGNEIQGFLFPERAGL